MLENHIGASNKSKDQKQNSQTPYCFFHTNIPDRLYFPIAVPSADIQRRINVLLYIVLRRLRLRSISATVASSTIAPLTIRQT